MLLIQMLFLQILLLFNFNWGKSNKPEVITSFKNIKSYADLKAKRAFSFSAISDIHGETPLTDVHVSLTGKFIKSDQSKFVLGLGDIDVSYKEDKLLGYFVRNNWWMTNYYPTVGDTEDQYFLDDPYDETYKSAKLYLRMMQIDRRKNVVMSPGMKQYYATMKHQGITIHFISLYYTDVMHGNRDLFPPESKTFLMNTLNSIEKGENDIIVVGAHTEFGTFADQLDPVDRNMVMNKCDLLLSGGIHYFERHIIDGFEEKGALNISCGSANKARWEAPNGFVQVHVFKDPLSIVVQYVDVSKPEIQLVDTPYSYLKIINGKKYPLSLIEK